MDQMIYAIISVKSDQGKLDELLTGLKGIFGADLYSVSSDEISAVVSDMVKVDLVANQLNAMAFAAVIESLAQHFTLLPMRFGSVMDSPHTIRIMLEKNYSEFQNNLQKVETRDEFGLKVFCDSEKIKANLLAKSERENEISEKPVTESKDSVFREYINQKLKAHRIEEMLLSYVDSIIAEFTEFLDHLNAAKKIKKLVTATTIIDAVFLLDKDKKDELVGAIEAMQSKYPGLNFILTGPWPPYSFVEITLK
jgi:hypothetical protein